MVGLLRPKAHFAANQEVGSVTVSIVITAGGKHVIQHDHSNDDKIQMMSVT